MALNKVDSSDHEIVQLVLENPNNYALIIQRYEAPLLRYIRRLTSVDLEGAQDILQEVFIKVYLNLNDFDNSLKFSSWIYRITHNQVISEFRKLKSRAHGNQVGVEDFVLENLKDEFNITKDCDNEFLQSAIQNVLQDMKPVYKEVIVLQYFEQKSYQEISDILQKPKGTIATLVNRAKKQFLKVANKKNIQF